MPASTNLVGSNN